MKTILRLIAFVLIFHVAALLAQAAPADVTLACDVQLPLNGVTAVRFYERAGTAAPFTYALARETPVTSALATGILVATGIVSVAADGLPHIFVARTVTTSTPLPATVATVGGESADANIVSVTVTPGGGTGPKNHRATVIKLN